jgi:hypothetical protein
MNIERAIEMIECAKVNTDNIAKVGLVMIQIVKEQLNEAIKALEDENERQP